MRLARGCATYVIFPFILTGIMFTAGSILDSTLILFLAFLFLIISFSMIVFFRDPELEIGEDLVSPADGKVFAIERIDGKLIIRIFMNVWNVHVNRIPFDGRVTNVDHVKGGHIPAFDKDAETNERVITDMETSIGDVRIVQIAGAVARRIVPYITRGSNMKKGDRMGIIRLGSRVDVHVLEDRVRPLVKVGDIVHPGQTIAAVIDVDEKYQKAQEIGGSE